MAGARSVCGVWGQTEVQKGSKVLGRLKRMHQLNLANEELLLLLKS